MTFEASYTIRIQRAEEGKVVLVHAIKHVGGVEAQLHLFVTWARSGGEY